VKERILVVECELATGLDLVLEIEQFGYEVVGLTDRADEALEIAYLLQPDIALIEIGIPGTLDGIHTAGLLLRAFEIPTIFLASNLEPSALARAEEAFPLGYLAQPHKSEELKAVFEFALRQTRKRKALRRTSTRAAMGADKREFVPS
jgi:two-component system, response regulator PdtaR